MAASLLAQPGACPPPVSPQVVQAGATAGMDASCCSIAASRRVISSLIASVRRRQVAISKARGVAEPAGERVGQLPGGGLQLGVAERGQRRRAALAGDQGAGNRRPLAPNRPEITTEIFSSASSRIFPGPVLVPDLVLGQPGPGPGQRPQIPDRLGRHERARDAAPLVQLAQPHAVFPAACAPAGQVPDVPGAGHTCRPAASAR
jgi:hypothetical protein